jgi:hypothetical protein
LGERARRESGPGVPADVGELQRRITRLERKNIELIRESEEAQADLEAARAANRGLTKVLNWTLHRGRRDRC